MWYLINDPPSFSKDLQADIATRFIYALRVTFTGTSVFLLFFFFSSLHLRSFFFLSFFWFDGIGYFFLERSDEKCDLQTNERYLGRRTLHTVANNSQYASPFKEVKKKSVRGDSRIHPIKLFFWAFFCQAFFFFFLLVLVIEELPGLLILLTFHKSLTTLQASSRICRKLPSS